MDYVQDLISVLNDSNLLLEGEECSILKKFSDEIVGFHDKSNTNFAQNIALMNAFKKLIESGLFLRYLNILLNRSNYTMENFYRRMDEE